MYRRRAAKMKCGTCGSGHNVAYVPLPNTIPGAAHGGRFICGDCLYLEEHPDAARLAPPVRRKTPQDESLLDARSEARYEWTDADTDKERREAALWGLGGAESDSEGQGA